MHPNPFPEHADEGAHSASANRPGLAPVGDDAPQVFFVRGYMKSGTNWVNKLLNLHPHIFCQGEFHWERLKQGLDDNLQRVNRFQKNELGLQVVEEFEAFVRRCLIRAARRPARWLGDRTPTSIEPFIIRDAPYITVARDGRDVLVSRVFHLYNRPDVTRAFDSSDLLAKRLAAFQADSDYFHKKPEELLADETMVKQSARNWSKTVMRDQQTLADYPDMRLLRVRYEQCHADTEGERRRMYELLGLDPSEAAPLSDDARPGFQQERPDSFYRKGQVGDWKNYMTPDAAKWFKEIAGETLVELGYEDNLDW